MKRLFLLRALIVVPALSFAVLFPAVPVHAFNGRIKVKCNVDAKVLLNDLEVGETGEVISKLPFGKCTMKVAAEGYKTHVEAIEILGNEVIEIEVELVPGKGEVRASSGQSKKIDEEEPGEESEEEEPEKEKPKKFEISEVRKLSRDDDIDRLREVLKSDSEFLVRLGAAAALIRLKSPTGKEFLGEETDASFKNVPEKLFVDSPLFTYGRMLVTDREIGDALADKEVEFDSLENIFIGYVAIIKLIENRENNRKEIKKLQRKMARLKRTKPRGWWGEYSQHDHEITRMADSIKNSVKLVSKLTSMLKDAIKLKNEDLSALAKHLHKDASKRK
ncbi:MAG: PEGA domain-containing protein [Planctomycetota bacterium]|jgi:hypothetical protein